MRAPAIVLCFFVGSAVVSAQRYQDFITPTPLGEGETLVVGFLGGRESWDNHKRGVRKLALKLRAMKLPGVHVETVRNTKRPVALALVRNAFDRNRDGRLDERERASARVIVYGQSFGGAAVVKFARELDALGVPILLTVQVDSVGRGDALIPPNVARAANLFQRDGFTIRGEREIRAADPVRTTILGNYRFTYRGKKIDLSEVSWFKRLLQRAHTKMDHDPEVWALVEKTILGVLGTERTASRGVITRWTTTSHKMTSGRRERAQRREPGERSEPAKRRASETVGSPRGEAPRIN